MASVYPAPSASHFVALSCTNVGVGPGGTVNSHSLCKSNIATFSNAAFQTSMLAYVIKTFSQPCLN